MLNKLDAAVLSWLRAGFVSFFGLCVCHSGNAEFSLPDTAQIHGFASVGYFKTTENNFFGDTKGAGDIDFWELGINGSWRAHPDFQLSMQVVSRKAGETDDGSLRIDYGFADYSFFSNADNLWGGRLGRVVNPFGLYNDTRDMPFTRPSILLPQSVYFDRNRQFALSGDGGQLYGEHRADWGDLFLQFNVVYPRVEDPDFIRFVAGSSKEEPESELSWVGRLVYEKDAGRYRFALSGSQSKATHDPKDGTSNMNIGKFKFIPVLFSAQYNAERWSLTGEYAVRRIQFSDFGPSRPDVDTTGESYYIQGTYRFHPRWEGVLRYDVLYIDRDDRHGKKFETVTGGGVSAHSRFAEDWTIGLRWDVTRNFMLRAEYHLIDGTAWLSPLENSEETDQHWELFSLLMAYRF